MKGSKYRSKWFYLAVWVLLAGFTFTIGGCGADTKSLVSTATGGLIDTGGGTTDTTTTVTKKVTTVAGKVKLSSTVGGGTSGFKARPKALVHPKMANAKGKPMGKVMKGEPGSFGNRFSKVVNRAVSHAAVEISGAYVFMYDADHSEWLYPIASTTTDTSGGFKLEKLAYATENSAYGATYTNDDTIPAGSYTIIVDANDYSTSSITNTTNCPCYPYYDSFKGKAYRKIIGIQAVVKKFEGDITGNDLEVQTSDSVPKVTSIMGRKTADLTITSGKYDLGSIPLNAAVQVIFDMAMHRANTPAAITLADSSGNKIVGSWKMSPDLKVATFYPTSPLTKDQKYTLTVSSTGTSNYYGKGLKADESATYTAGGADTTVPTGIAVSPESQTGVSITDSIKFATNEAIDINTITVSSTPSIGDKPAIISLGYKNVTGGYDYFYQIDTGGNPLSLATDYSITVSGGKDLAGNSMNSFTFSFQTETTSSGVTGTGTTAVAQSSVKGTLGDFVDAINSSDLNLFGSMLTGDFTMKFKEQSTRCTDCPQAYDKDRNGSLSYDEFTGFIEAWFNNNEKILGWTGADDGIHLIGDIVSGTEIKVDETAGTAAFGFTLTYTKADGTTYSFGSDTGKSTITMYVVAKDINGGWFISELSEKDVSGKIGVTSLPSITTSSPTEGQELSKGTKSIDFKWTPVSGATSYTVVLMDAFDPKGETGWVGIIDADKITGTVATLTYNANNTKSDFDPSDGTLAILGGEKDAPFNKRLTLQDGGSYIWFVASFKTLVASKFGAGVDPDADMGAMSSNVGFTVGGTYTSALSVKIESLSTSSSTITGMVTLSSTTASSISFSDTISAWNTCSSELVSDDSNADCGTSAARLTIKSSKGVEGKVYVYGNYYKEYPFKFMSGSATVDIDLYDGYNWIDVTDGINWWYAITAATADDGTITTTLLTNYIYTNKGITYNELTVESVSAAGTSYSRAESGDLAGYYEISNVTSVTIKGEADTHANKVYVYNSAQDSKGNNYFVSTSADVVAGAYEATVDIFSGYNGISIEDGFGNWAYVNVYNGGTGATEVADYIYNVMVDGKSPDETGGSTYKVNATSVKISGNLNSEENGYWYASGTTNYESGTLWNTDGSFSFPIRVDSGTNYVYLYDANWNYKSITINNEASTTTIASSYPNVLTMIGSHKVGTGLDHEPMQWDRYEHPADTCTITIEGKSSASAGKDITMYFSYYGATTIDDALIAKADMSGNYKFTVSLGYGDNYLDIYDSGWNWQGVVVTTTKTDCSVTTVPLTADIYKSVSDASPISSSDNYNYDAGTSSSVTIKGNAKTGKTVSIALVNKDADPDYYDYFSATASGDKYSINVSLASGYNELSISDGSTTWIEKRVKSSTTTTVTSVTLSADVYKVEGTTTTKLTMPSGGWYYDAGTSTSVTIKGSAKSGRTVGISLSNYGTAENKYASYYDYFTTTATSDDKYSINVSLANGYNYIIVSDGYTSLYPTIYSSGTTASTSVTLTASIYKSAGDITAMSLTSNWYYDAGGANSITVRGDAKSGRTVYVSLSNYDTYPYTYNSLSTTANSENKYSIDVSLSKGYNYLTVGDNYNYLYPVVYSTYSSSASYKHPTEVKVDTVSSSSDYDSTYYGSGSWNVTTSSVTVTGKANNGTGYYYHYDKNWYTQSYGNLTISGNSFSLSLNLKDGYNYVYLYDSNWNYYYMTIYTSGGVITYDHPKNVKVDTVSASSEYDSTYYGSGSWNVSVFSVTVTGNAKNGTGYYYHYNSSWSTIASGSLYISNNSFSQSLNLSNGYNYVYWYDSSWNYYYATIYTSAVAVTYDHPKNVKVDTVSSSSEYDSTYYGSGSWNITASSVTVTGNAKNGTGYYYHYNSSWSTIASGSLYISNNSFSQSLNLSNGYNYVYLYDSSWNYYYATIYTSGGTVTYNHPTNVKVDTVSSSSNYESTYYGSGSWNITASSVTVTGNAGNGTGYYYHYDKDWYSQSSGNLTISENSFSLSLNLKNGYNYVYVYDSSWNYYYLTIYTSGGTTAAKIVGITSPKHNDTVSSGTITVKGVVDRTKMTPTYIYAYIYNYSNYTSKYYYYPWYDYYSGYGYGLITYNSTTGEFSFDASIGSNTYIYVYAYDGYYSHGHTIYVNNTYNYSESSWKPSTSDDDAGAAAHTEFVKWMTNDMKKHQQQ